MFATEVHAASLLLCVCSDVTNVSQFIPTELPHKSFQMKNHVFLMREMKKNVQYWDTLIYYI